MAILFGTGFGIALHDFAHALWQVGSYQEVLSYQGGYIGFLFMLVAFIIVIFSKEEESR